MPVLLRDEYGSVCSTRSLSAEGCRLVSRLLNKKRIVGMRSKMRLLVLSVCLWGGIPLSVGAQSLEVGGTFGTHNGAQVGVWLTGQSEVVARIAWGPLRQSNGVITYYVCTSKVAANECPVNVVVRNVSQHRQFQAFYFFHHFRPGTRVRPFLGAGLGSFRHTVQNSCQIAGCEAALARGTLGRRTFSYGDVIVSAGLTTTIAGRIVLRGGVQLHNLLQGEKSGLNEASIGLGYRF